MSDNIYSTQSFIQKARKIHGDKYDYSKVVYKNYNTKVIIICPIHGEFKQLPYNHSKGHGCSLCAGKKFDTDEFIKRARKIHGNKYSYPDPFAKSHQKIRIVCPIHGDFWQSPTNHLNTPGCPECSFDKHRLGYNLFIKKARKIHGTKYSYKKFKYTNNGLKITIMCPKHGKFKQRIRNHLRGQGCPDCGLENIPGSDYSKSKDDGILYFLTCKLGNEYFCKIGITKHSILNRFRYSEFEILDSVVFEGKISKHYSIEQQIKSEFKDFRFHTNTKFNGKTECIAITKQKQIKNKLLRLYTI